MAFEPDILMILIFGKQGQLAQAFKEKTPSTLDGRVVFVSSHEANFERPEFLEGFLDHQSPEVVIVCSAYTKVDQAEEEKEIAEKINVIAPREVARWCGKNGALMIYFSTDYVFSGEGDIPWKEDNEPRPLNWYGETKLEAERAIFASGCAHYIFRVSWLYSENGKNFLKTIVKLAKDKTSLRIVKDQVGSPTYAMDVAENVWKVVSDYLVGIKKRNGIYHLCGQGFVSWAGFAEAILTEMRRLGMESKVDMLEPIPTADYPTTAERPLNSRMDCLKVQKEFGLALPPWKESMKVCLQKLKGLK